MDNSDVDSTLVYFNVTHETKMIYEEVVILAANRVVSLNKTIIHEPVCTVQFVSSLIVLH